MKRLLSCCIVAVVACGTAPQVSTPVPAGTRIGEANPERCRALRGQPGPDAVANLRGLAVDCGAAAGLVALSTARRGRQAERDRSELLTFPVTRPGRCFRVLAAGGGGVEELDLLVRAPDGSVLVGDLSSDALPVAPPRGLWCAPVAGTYAVEVGVRRGAGEFAVQLFVALDDGVDRAPPDEAGKPSRR